MQVEKQFFHTLESTIEIELPLTASKEQCEKLIEEMSVELKLIVFSRISFSEKVIGNQSKRLDQVKFIERATLAVQTNI